MIVLSVFLDQLAVCHRDSLFLGLWSSCDNCVTLLCLISEAVVCFAWICQMSRIVQWSYLVKHTAIEATGD